MKPSRDSHAGVLISARTGDGRFTRVLRLALLAAAAVCAGCGSSQKDKIWVYRYPAFYRPDIKRVAVHRFENRTQNRGAGVNISDRLSAYLTNNRTYEVYDRQRLESKIRAEQDMAVSNLFDPNKAIETGRLISAQVLIYGSVNRYEVTTRNETRYNNVPIWGYNAQGQYVITGWNQIPYVWIRYDATVECSVIVADATTGQQIAAVQYPSTYWASGSPPQYTAAQCLRFAEDNQVNLIFQELAITQTEIELEEDVLRTAKGQYDGKWEWQSSFTPKDEKVCVVVTLPPTADRNRFRLTVVPKGKRDIVGEQVFAWEGRFGSAGKWFDVQPMVDKAGYGTYTAKIYSGQEPFSTYHFTLRK